MEWLHVLEDSGAGVREGKIMSKVPCQCKTARLSESESSFMLLQSPNPSCGVLGLYGNVIRDCVAAVQPHSCRQAHHRAC